MIFQKKLKLIRLNWHQIELIVFQFLCLQLLARPPNLFDSHQAHQWCIKWQPRTTSGSDLLQERRFDPDVFNRCFNEMHTHHHRLFTYLIQMVVLMLRILHIQGTSFYAAYWLHLSEMKTTRLSWWYWTSKTSLTLHWRLITMMARGNEYYKWYSLRHSII